MSENARGEIFFAKKKIHDEEVHLSKCCETCVLRYFIVLTKAVNFSKFLFLLIFFFNFMYKHLDLIEIGAVQRCTVRDIGGRVVESGV